MREWDKGEKSGARGSHETPSQPHCGPHAGADDSSAADPHPPMSGASILSFFPPLAGWRRNPISKQRDAPHRIAIPRPAGQYGTPRALRTAYERRTCAHIYVCVHARVRACVRACLRWVVTAGLECIPLSVVTRLYDDRGQCLLTCVRLYTYTIPTYHLSLLAYALFLAGSGSEVTAFPWAK